MAESSVNVTEGSGKRLHTYDRSVSAVVVNDQFTIAGEYVYPSYIVYVGGVTTATAGDHLLQVMAGASNYVRVRRIWIGQTGLASTAGQAYYHVVRLTTAGSGNSASGATGTTTVRRLDESDPAPGATAFIRPATKGTEAAIVTAARVAMYTTHPVGEGSEWEWVQQINTKPLVIPPGTSNGLAVKVSTAGAGATVDVSMELVETSYL